MGASSAGRTAEFSKPVIVTADPATNALVISAAPQDWETLRNIIAELDVPRIQVFVQAIIVEVSAERQRELGVEFSGLDRNIQQHTWDWGRSTSASCKMRSAIRWG